MTTEMGQLEGDWSIKTDYGENKKKAHPRSKTCKESSKSRTPEEKYQWVFINGKQVRIKRPPTIDGMDIDEFIRRNADPIWLHQNEMWEYIEPKESAVSEHEKENRDDVITGPLR